MARTGASSTTAPAAASSAPVSNNHNSNNNMTEPTVVAALGIFCLVVVVVTMARTGASSTTAPAAASSAPVSDNHNSNNNINDSNAPSLPPSASNQSSSTEPTVVAAFGLFCLVVVVVLFYFLPQPVAGTVTFTGLTVGALWREWGNVVDRVMQEDTKKNDTAVDDNDDDDDDDDDESNKETLNSHQADIVTKRIAGTEPAVDTDTHNWQNILAAASGYVGDVPIINNHRSNHNNHNISETAARALLREEGFRSGYLNERANGLTPLSWFIKQGNIAMIRYLIAHGADGRKADSTGWFPMISAAVYGHLEIMKLLSRDGGAHEDIRRVTKDGSSPLRIAFMDEDAPVVQWLIRNEALSTVSGGGGVDDMVMRRDLRPSNMWDHDKRETVRLWAETLVAAHDNAVQLLFTGMVASSKQKASPLAIFDGKSGVLKLIAEYGVTGSPQQLRTLRQLTDLLPAFINDTPFVRRERPRRRPRPEPRVRGR